MAQENHPHSAICLGFSCEFCPAFLHPNSARTTSPIPTGLGHTHARQSRVEVAHFHGANLRCLATKGRTIPGSPGNYYSRGRRAVGRFRSMKKGLCICSRFALRPEARSHGLRSGGTQPRHAATSGPLHVGRQRGSDRFSRVRRGNDPGGRVDAKPEAATGLLDAGAVMERVISEARVTILTIASSGKRGPR